ncbi:hypothetical protein Ppb6_00635 [Photorhabdus australis subsp. thailandensis]|uniref:Uncharacterized protein n=1 Tax=Photorhabdus australis subsp. thailandensis TaxID=2805096 RepID=A0A1C0U894_9GAMM|nr:hypothetical protein [Photorhabdus australis]OCQ54141.1 hypothetical protein Ppb6_00635 [Photorhabdus australis subsp. thailandensis]
MAVTTGRTAVRPQNTDVHVKAEPALYFHPDSETLIFVNKEDIHELEAEHNFLSLCVEQRIEAELKLAALTEQCTQQTMVPAYGHEVRLKAAYDELNNACDRLHNQLTTLSPPEYLPKTTLLDENAKKSAIGITELIAMDKGYQGYKYTYVRSDKIKSHWRRYKLNDQDKKSGGKSFLREVAYTDKEGNSRTRMEIDGKKLESQIGKLKPALTVVDVKLIDDHSGIWGQWAKDLNDSLKTSPYDGEHIGFDSQSQLMRWSYGAGAKAELNPLEISKHGLKGLLEGSGKVNFYANFALAESRTRATLHLPDKTGVKLSYPRKDGGEGMLGMWRFDLTLTLSGSVGASLGIEAGVNLKGNVAKGIPAKMALDGNGIPGRRKVDVSKMLEDSDSGGELSMFAGAECGANLSGSLMWKNPDKDPMAFRTLAKVSIGARLQAGVGISGVVSFSYRDGHIRVMAKGGLCWGVGGKGSVSFDIDGEEIWEEFMPCLAYMLRNMDYVKLLVMTEEHYYAFCMMPLIKLGEFALTESTEGLISVLKESWEDKEKRVALMEKINDSQGDVLKYAPPETRGAVIAALIETNFWDEVASPASHRELKGEIMTVFSARKRAVLEVLKWVQSKRDYEHVMQNLHKVPGEGGEVPKEGGNKWKAGEEEVIAFLGRGEAPRVYGRNDNFVPLAAKVIIEPSHYAKNLKDIYDWLPTSEESAKCLNEPLKPVNAELFKSATQVVIEQHRYVRIFK